MIELEELAHQEYENCCLSSGKVTGKEPDTIYLMFEREGEEDKTLYLRPDEALSIVWLLSGTLWSNRISEMIEIDDLRDQLLARERDLIALPSILLDLAKALKRVEELEASLGKG